MRPAVQFLTALAQAVSTLNLYKEGHPARERAVEGIFDKIQLLQEEDVQVEFLFLGEDVVFQKEPLRELKAWDWGERLARIGVQKLEFLGPVSRTDLEYFMEEILARLAGTPIPSAEIRQTRETAIRYGALKLKTEEEEEGEDDEEIATATLGFNLREEAETVRWIHDELKEREELHLLEAEAIVRSLSVAMHGDSRFLMPLLQLKEFDQYTTTHALNVSVLAMGLAEFIGLGPAEVRDFGMSGLLHDLGKIRVPDEILNKPGTLTPEEREVMNSHTVEGARIIMESDDHLDLAAVVAYEHHIQIDGGGYPTLSYPRSCHQCSNLVHVCDVYDALRTNRPYREAWEHQQVVDYIAEGAGKEFDRKLAHGFVEMMDRWETRIAVMEDEDQLLPTPEEEASGE